MKTGQTHPEGKTGKWYSKWLKTLFMDGNAIRSSWEFPFLEALIFHVEWLYGLIGCCVVFERQYRFLGLWLVTSEKTDDQVEREQDGYPSKSQQQMCMTSRGTEGNYAYPPLLSCSHYFLSSDLRNSFSMAYFHTLSFVSSGKQATYKDVKEYFESSVEWNTSVSWYNSSWHDHKDTKVSAQKFIFDFNHNSVKFFGY